MAAAPSGSASQLASAVALAALLALARCDPASWTPDQCQCEADPDIAALCTKATFYPPGIVEDAWESIGDQYVTILDDGSLTEEQRTERYRPLISQTGLPAANFTVFATKYAAFKRLPTAEQMRARSSYCSVSNGDLGLMPCLCRGGGVAELSLSIVEPVPIQFLTEEDVAKAKVVQVLQEKLSETLGLWYTGVAVGSHSNGQSGDTVATVHVTFSTLESAKIEQRFPTLQALLGQAGELTLADGSGSLILGASTLDSKVPFCNGPVSPPSDLPAQATANSDQNVVAGGSVSFTCPEGLKFSNGKRVERRNCGVSQLVEPATGGGEPLTCVDESVTSATTAASTPNGRSTPSAAQMSTRSTTAYVPDQYEELDVDWNDGESIKKVDPNKPNLLLRITIPAASVIFSFLVLYLLCTRPESCMCNTCGGGKLDEVQ
ncbi:uncharacterized protein LOC119113146 [Pollicipes pollicipes]|uniref:uncharacterized protein LOC119113146 n=1 Tax=Pollicipes pollicipes TaxID=41117 RepID=UPI0018851BC6|nr:uncharacterized protein LOC119113146 [Pollicipes pollicipes]